MTKTSKINLIDLAGSERASQVLNDQVIKTAETAALRLKVTTTLNNNTNLYYLESANLYTNIIKCAIKTKTKNQKLTLKQRLNNIKKQIPANCTQLE